MYCAAAAQFNDLDSDVLYQRILGEKTIQSKIVDTIKPIENVLDQLDFDIFENRNNSNLQKMLHHKDPEFWQCKQLIVK